MDLSKLSNAELEALASGDMAKVSDATLQYLSQADTSDLSTVPPSQLVGDMLPKGPLGDAARASGDAYTSPSGASMMGAGLGITKAVPALAKTGMEMGTELAGLAHTPLAKFLGVDRLANMVKAGGSLANNLKGPLIPEAVAQKAANPLAEALAVAPAAEAAVAAESAPLAQALSGANKGPGSIFDRGVGSNIFKIRSKSNPLE